MLRRRGLRWHRHAHGEAPAGPPPDLPPRLVGSKERGALDTARALRILCLGDSLTSVRYPCHLARRLATALAVAPLVTDAGMPGFTSDQYLAYFEATEPVRRRGPDCVFVLLGTNDLRVDRSHRELSTTTGALATLLRRLLAPGPGGGGPSRLAIATVPPVVPVAYHYNEDSAWRVEHELNPAIRRLAARFALELVDVHRLFAENPRLLAPGDVHPTPEGDRRLADAWAAVALRWLGVSE